MYLSGNSYGTQFFKELNKYLESVESVRNLILADIFTTRKDDIMDSCEEIVKGFANKNLKLFDISNNALCPDGCLIIGKLFQTNQSLKYLWLNHVAFSRDGTEYISKAITDAKLDLFSLQVNKNRMGEKGHFFGKMLNSQTNLKDLILYQNDLKENCLKENVASLKTMPNLEILDISDNLFNLDNLQIFLDSLLYLKNLKVLNLSDCNIGTDGSKLLIPVLKKFAEFTELEEFYYNYNEVDEEDLEEFFEIIAKFKNLKKLECKIDLEDEMLEFAQDQFENLNKENCVLESDEEMDDSYKSESPEEILKKEKNEFNEFLNKVNSFQY